ncbi:MAG: cysteine desulfurase family protein [Acidimicrobiales bacterium]|jgi:cysteine desulfurase
MSARTESEETYLDWAASTPMRPEALQAMVQAAQDGYGNPTGAHHRARVGRRIVDDARDQVADAVGAEPSEVIFCGSGTEADNLAIFGAHATNNGHVACSAIEHHAVLHPVQHLGGTVLDVDSAGQLDIAQLRSIANDDLAIVSVMLANNETGVVQRLDEIRAVLDELAPNALLHTDAVQAFPWLDVAELAAPADLISLSGHKFGGPKGVGVLIVRSHADIKAQTLGGGQEFELRSGTHNVAGIAALGVAAQMMASERAQVVENVGALRDRLVGGIMQALPDTIESARQVGDAAVEKVAGSAHVCFPGIESEALLFKLERVGIYASAASSCASGAQDPSHVLAAMGYPRELAAGSLRMSLGFGTTDADIDRALAIIPECVQTLRAASA